MAKPFLKWAGGKSSSLEAFNNYYPKGIMNGKLDDYIEPFVGGGAVFFDVIKKANFKNIILNDLTEELINAYNIIQNHVDELISTLKLKEKEYLDKDKDGRKRYYYNTRHLFNKQKLWIKEQSLIESIDFAANLIFLNRTCFNGLYRLNSKGEFNVPIGSYTNPTICNSSNLKSVSNALKNVILTSKDFENSIDILTNSNPSKTFIYIDPPYRPLPFSQSFKSYSKSDFNDSEQERLASWFCKLDKEGYYLMLSNSDPTEKDPNDTFFEELYKGYNIKKIKVPRAINSKGTGRNAIPEILVTNY